MQKLEFFQSLWAMERRHPDYAERDHAENFDLIAAAGYDGVCLDPAVDEIEKYRATLPHFARHGLKSMVNLFPRRSRDMKPLLAFARELGAQISQHAGHGGGGGSGRGGLRGDVDGLRGRSDGLGGCCEGRVGKAGGLSPGAGSAQAEEQKGRREALHGQPVPGA